MAEESQRSRSQLTDAGYWSEVWSAGDLPAAIDPESTPFLRDFCAFLSEAVSGWSGSLLEIGCGCSRWLPFFAHLGFSVAGVDHSGLGCEQARRILERERIAGDIYERDAFEANSDLAGRFDVVVSLGVVEHFRDTVEPLRAFARYLKPRGLMISTCPNMSGVLGLGQKLLDRAVYERHVPMTTERLRRAHEMAGLTVTRCSYIGGLDFHMIGPQRATPFKNFAHRGLMRLSRMGWRLPLRLKPGRALSSAVGCAAYQDRALG